jgi:uncharacterized membrane protein
MTLQQVLPYLLTSGGLIGLVASFILTVEKIALIRDPSFVPSCNFNPILSCGSVMNTPQAEVFGFPNSLLGIVGFAIVTTVGMAMLSGAKFRRWFWIGLQAGVTLGLAFVFWLQFQSIYRIGALCPYCMVVWTVTIPIFWYVTLYNLRSGHFGARLAAHPISRFIQRHHGDILIVWFVIILGLIAKRFWYFWSSLI